MQSERETAYALFQRGSRMLAERPPGAAAILLERALALEPGKASILEALGQAYFNHGSHDLAPHPLGGRGPGPAPRGAPTPPPRRAAAIAPAAPRAPSAHFGLGLSRARLGDARTARRHLRMAVF